MSSPDIIANQSPDSMHIRGSESSHQQVTKVEQPRESKWIAGLLGASIVVNFWAGLNLFWDAQEKRLLQEHQAEDTAAWNAKHSDLEARISHLEHAGPLVVIVKQEK
jgi:hypothetical protein